MEKRSIAFPWAAGAFAMTFWTALCFSGIVAFAGKARIKVHQRPFAFMGQERGAKCRQGPGRSSPSFLAR